MAAPLLAAGIAAAGNLVNGLIQGDQNRKQREWQEKMYGVQRQHALEDRDWQAQYNSPAEQMARLKAAGLNPNLVYGNGTATQDAPSIRSSQIGTWNPQAPNFDAGSVLGTYMDTAIKTAQTDNLKLQAEKLEAEKNYIQAQTVLSLENSKGKAFDNYLNSELRNNTIEFRDGMLRKIRAEIDSVTSNTFFAGEKNKREQSMNEAQITQIKDNVKTMAVSRLEAMSRMETNAVQRSKMQDEIKSIRQGTYNNMLEGQLKDLELERQKRGASVSDPWYLKRVDALAEKFIGKWKR